MTQPVSGSGFTMALWEKIGLWNHVEYGAGRRGFTLIELMVVIVILSVLAMVVIPRLPMAREGDLKASARTLAAALRYLNDRSIATKNRYLLRIAFQDGSMKVTRVIREGEETAVPDPFLLNLSLREGVGIADVVTARLGKITEGEAVLGFSPLGVEDFSVIHLKSEDGKRFYTVALYPGSGRVTVLEGYEEGTLPEEEQEGPR